MEYVYIIISLLILGVALYYLINNVLYSTSYCKQTDPDFIDIAVQRSGLYKPKKCFLFW